MSCVIVRVCVEERSAVPLRRQVRVPVCALRVCVRVCACMCMRRSGAHLRRQATCVFVYACVHVCTHVRVPLRVCVWRSVRGGAGR
jgi:hypothetical protein